MARAISPKTRIPKNKTLAISSILVMGFSDGVNQRCEGPSSESLEYPQAQSEHSC
jgi:hypothetical protein